MEWLNELKGTQLFQDAGVKSAAERLHKYQSRFQELPSILKQAGVKNDDPLTVGVFVEAVTRIGEQQVAEGEFVAAVLLAEIRKHSAGT